MSTYGQALVSEIDEALCLLNQYLIEGYESADIKNLLSKIASTTELFLKRDVFPHKNSRDNFYSFIEELKAHSISDIKADFIHNIRIAYNDAKHDPNCNISVLLVKTLLENLQLSLSDILVNNLGRVNASIQSNTARVFWICAWDHYTGGVTEVTVFLPSDYDGFLGAHSIDHVMISALEWNNFKADLPNFGSVYAHDGLIPEEQVNFWLSQGDSLNPFVFEGEYNSLIICLSKYLKDVNLMHGLAREDNPENLLQTAAMAVSDAYAANPNAGKEAHCTNALFLANNQYAVLPKFNDRIEPYINKIIDVIDQVPKNVKPVLTGPVWVTQASYEANSSSYRDDTIRTLVDSKNRIVLGVRKI